MFPILPLRVPRGLDIHPAGPGDRDELVALLDRFHRRYELAPVFEDGGFEEVLGRSPGMELGDYLLAHRRGRLVAALGVWDQHDVKRTRVLGMPRRLRAFTTAVRGGARVLPLPRLPAVGETLDFRYARHAAHEPGHERALRALVRSAVNAVRRRGEHFLLFTCAQGDPIVSVLRRIPRSSYRYRVVAGANRPEAEVILDRLCGALIYDDAALS